MNNSRNILISSNNIIYNFINYKLEDSDGSFYITIQRKGVNSEFIQMDSNNDEILKYQLNKGREKRKKISYHASGCVRYHNINNVLNYFEPICNITKLNIIAEVIIPQIDKFDTCDNKLSKEDNIITIDNSKIPYQFTFIVAPWNHQFDSPYFAIRYKNLFSFIIQISKPLIKIKTELREKFIYITPKIGLSEKQMLDKDSALISFHQKINNINDMIIYSPNNEGIYKIVFVVPMRIPPELIIKFNNDSYSCEIVSKTRSIIRFKVKDRNNNTLKNEVKIIDILLNAEF